MVVGIVVVGNAGVVEVFVVGGLEVDFGNFGDIVIEIGVFFGVEVVVEVDVGLVKVDEIVVVVEVVFDKIVEFVGIVVEVELVV